MADKLPADAPTLPELKDGNYPPVIYFDEAPTFGFNNGIGNVTLGTMRFRPDGKGNVGTVFTAVADLRCNLPAAKALLNALEKMILLAETPKSEPN